MTLLGVLLGIGGLFQVGGIVLTFIYPGMIRMSTVNMAANIVFGGAGLVGAGGIFLRKPIGYYAGVVALGGGLLTSTYYLVTGQTSAVVGLLIGGYLLYYLHKYRNTLM